MPEFYPAPALPEWTLDLLPPDPRRYMVEVGDYRMHVMEYGEGYPLLMVHGNPTWGFLYRKIVKELMGEGFRIILPDLIGLGYSEKPKSMESHSLQHHIDWLAKLIGQLDLESCICVNQDWGGAISMGALAQYPGLLKGLVVLNTVLGPPREGFKATGFHRFAHNHGLSDIAFRVFGFPQRMLHRVQGDPESIKGMVARSYYWPLRGMGNNAAPLALARMVPDDLDHPSVPVLEKVRSFTESFKGPTSLVWGMNDPILKKLLNRTKRMLPHASVRETQAGHFLQEEVPEEIAQAIREVRQQLASPA
ncbi:MAG: alpha/beta fold hydrolase [Bacteroidota bacterium]